MSIPTGHTEIQRPHPTQLGGHAVGMSTVLECMAARWVGLEVCGVSLVTNAGAGYSGEPLSHEEVLAAGAVAGPRLARVIRRFVADLPAWVPAQGRTWITIGAASARLAPLQPSPSTSDAPAVIRHSPAGRLTTGFPFRNARSHAASGSSAL